MQRPKAGTCLVCWRKNKDGTAAETERVRRREAGDKVGVAASGQILKGLAGQRRILDSTLLLMGSHWNI